MENEIENEGGISLGYIFRTIFSQKWLALIIAVVVTLAGTLGLYFWGRSDLNYSVSFVSKIPGSGSSPLEFVFPDGKEFRYETMVSLEKLEEAQKQSASFKNIKINEMYEKGDISINRVLAETVAGSKEYEATYVITAKAKYFKSGIIARDFLRELTQFPTRYLKEMTINFDRSLEVSRTAIQYDKQLDYLSEQVNFLNAEYNKFITEYTGNFMVKDGKTLNYYQAQLQTFLDRGDIARLKNEALEKSYVKADENGQPLASAIAKYTSEKDEKIRARAVIEKALEEALKLLASSGGQSSVIIDTEAIMQYTMQIAQLDKDLEYIQNFIDNKNTDADFDKQVDAIEKQIEVFTNDFTEIASTVYETKTTVSFLNTSIITVSGGRGIISSLIISFVAGVVLACIVAYIVGWSRSSKKASKKAECVPVYGEARLQAAVTSDGETEKEETKDDK